MQKVFHRNLTPYQLRNSNTTSVDIQSITYINLQVQPLKSDPLSPHTQPFNSKNSKGTLTTFFHIPPHPLNQLTNEHVQPDNQSMDIPVSIFICPKQVSLFSLPSQRSKHLREQDLTNTHYVFNKSTHQQSRDQYSNYN